MKEKIEQTTLTAKMVAESQGIQMAENVIKMCSQEYLDWCKSCADTLAYPGEDEVLSSIEVQDAYVESLEKEICRRLHEKVYVVIEDQTDLSRDIYQTVEADRVYLTKQEALNRMDTLIDIEKARMLDAEGACNYYMTGGSIFFQSTKELRHRYKDWEKYHYTVKVQEVVLFS